MIKASFARNTHKYSNQELVRVTTRMTVKCLESHDTSTTTTGHKENVQIACACHP